MATPMLPMTSSGRNIQVGGGVADNNDRDEGDILPPGQRFIIVSENTCYFRRFETRGRRVSFRVRPPPVNTEHLSWLDGAIRDVLTHLTNSCQPHDYAGMTFTAPALTHGPAWISFRPVREFSADNIWTLINDIAQRAREFRLDEGVCEMSVSVVRGVEGGAGKRLTHKGIAKDLILQIRNRDNLCLPRSIVASLVYSQRGELRLGGLHKNWPKIRDGRRENRRSKALELVC